MIFQKKAETPINITSVPNNFKSFIKQVYQKEWMKNINKKKGQNNYFRAEISQRTKSNLHLKKKSRLNFNDK